MVGDVSSDVSSRNDVQARFPIHLRLLVRLSDLAGGASTCFASLETKNLARSVTVLKGAVPLFVSWAWSRGPDSERVAA